MTKRIFRNILAVALCVFLACALLFLSVLYDYFSASLLRQLRVQLDLAGQGVLHEGIAYFDGIHPEEYRMTWIGTDGKVLYDSASDIQEMENHFAREEVKEALAEGYGESIRDSATLTQRYLYCAKRLPDGTVLRLSAAQNSLLVLMVGMLQPICVIFVIAVVLSIVLASRLSKKIVKPLNDLNLDQPLTSGCYDELLPLLRRIDLQQRQIRNQSNQLKQKQNEFETLTKGMAEGIALLDSNGFLFSMNPAAEALLLPPGSDPIGRNILSLNRSPELETLLEQASGGSHGEKKMVLKNRTYRVSANPVIEGSQIHGVVLLLLDITEKENGENMRREFTANVSHELKTPLQSILGSAELMKNGMVRQEDISHFSGVIYKEASRLVTLVDDIIHLSQLDEGTALTREPVDLLETAENAASALEDCAAKKQIQVSVTGENVRVNGVPGLLYEMIYNLCDNAVKYNVEGGRVDVSVSGGDRGAVVTVRDTGIGIPAEYHSGVFERFFRVDKSRSKASGGTGLGLSIVKHIAQDHGAAIELQSRPGRGTTVSVVFPPQAADA